MTKPPTLFLFKNYIMERTRRKLTSINFETGEVKFQESTILTCDPSFRAWGWAVVNRDNKVIDKGCIKTEPDHKKRRIRVSDDRTQRAIEITQTLRRIIQRYNVQFIVSEAPHGSQNAQGAVMIGIVLGITVGISVCMNIPIEYYSEQDAKKAVLGKKAATKKEMIRAIQELYDVKLTGVEYKDEAIADALAVHYVATQQSTVLKILKK